MEETKVRIGEEVLLDIGTHSEWYISSLGYDGESLDITLRRKADRDKDWWWLVDTPQTIEKVADFQTLCGVEIDPDDINRRVANAYAECGMNESQTDCGRK